MTPLKLGQHTRDTGGKQARQVNKLALALSSALISQENPVRSPYVVTEVPFSTTGHPMDGEYKLIWDDTLLLKYQWGRSGQQMAELLFLCP